jgi:hypothetical protein
MQYSGLQFSFDEDQQRFLNVDVERNKRANLLALMMDFMRDI